MIVFLTINERSLRNYDYQNRQDCVESRDLMNELKLDEKAEQMITCKGIMIASIKISVYSLYSVLDLAA